MQRDSWKLNIINESKYQVNNYSSNSQINEYDIYTNTFNISAYKKFNDKLTIQGAVAHSFRQIARNSTKT